jgi:gliding motility-associated-like protein
MRLVRFIAVLLFVFVHSLHAQTDSVGSGGAIKFDGLDDYINFGDIYSDLQLPFTISGWVYLDPSNNSPAPIFSNRNCDPIYTGFRLIVNNNVISMDYGDGFGGNSPAFRRGKNANVNLLNGNWNHITAVVKGVSDMDLYLNGINVGGSYTGGSSNLMDSSKPGFASSAYFISNGVIYRLNGIIDEIRLWNRALSESEIRNTMCINLTGNEPGLVGYWNFNETNGNTVYDLSNNHFNGTFVGSPIRVRSGAPIGDVSTYHYSSTWNGKAISLINDSQTLNAINISSSALGIHLYSVNHPPSQTTGLGTNQVNVPYFGVFMVQQNSANTFDVELINDNGEACAIFSRADNSSAQWLETTESSLLNRQQRIELIQSDEAQSPFDLGADVSLCNKDQFKISTGIDDPLYSFLWSNNKTTSSIVVSTSGKYTVTVAGPCAVMKDSLTVQFLNVPESFSLGEDVQTCNFKVTTLLVPDCPGCTVLWQDGSAKNEFQATAFGTYYATIKNECGQASDSIVFSKPMGVAFIPNVITPNGDGKNDFFEVPEYLLGSVSLDVYNRWGLPVYRSQQYHNEWNGGDLSSGAYFLILNSSCLEMQKFVLSIVK